MTLTPDGTLIQQLPAAMETVQNLHTGARTCTWRWWPRALE